MDPGATIGPFEIIAPLGSGGMGEVYRARDTRLGRLVALKFLAVGADGAARERFQREARAIAALSHPHICTLYEIGEHERRPYLVLELLEGETLRARLKRGPLATATLAEFAAQIADALDAAHRKGVLHRDLKPDNIWVGPGEQIKVLDFGLARLEEAGANGGSGGGPTPSQAETLLTSPGMTLGTIPYMSPEQARGEALDARSDIFSFGAVFYEMATGRAPFQAPSAGGLIAAIVKDDPPPAERLRPDLPPQLGLVARRCLEKDPELRYQSAAEVRAELRWLRRESAAAGAAAPAATAEPS
ncbi:MAG: serine/threonine-protein kinase, partial [Terriglobales bacterium]